MAKRNKKESTAKDFIGYIVSILCLLLCLYVTTKVIYGNVNNRPPKVFNVSVSYVPTDSMNPTIQSDSYVMFTGIGFDAIQTGSGTVEENHKNKDGDIIVYYNSVEQKLILHRVVGIGTDEDGKYLIMQGDNDSTNKIPDQGKNGVYKVRDYEVCGKYVTTLTFMSLFSGGVNTNVVFIIIVVIFVIMLGTQILSMYIKVKSDKLKKQKEEEAKDLKEQLRKEILAEEIAKLKAQRESSENKEDFKEV